MSKTKIGIIGATGYSGQELIRILENHPHVEITLTTSRAQKGSLVMDYYPSLHKKYKDLRFSDVDISEIADKCDLCFFATPSGTAKDLGPVLYRNGLKVVDISGDFRLTNSDDYKKWYGYEHPHPELLNEIVYCIPEINRHEARNSDFISNPGCYPTSILLPLTPVLKLIDSEQIIIDSKSGVTGAGKKVNENFMFSEMNENFYPYKIGGKHQHIPEIEKYLSEWTERKINVVFTPHLLPMNRGIISTIYIPYISEIKAKQVIEQLLEYYEKEIFVKVLRKGTPKTKDVRLTNQCHIGYAYDERADTLILVSAIDNLIRGASGQAVQNMNLMLGYDEGIGLC